MRTVVVLAVFAAVVVGVVWLAAQKRSAEVATGSEELNEAMWVAPDGRDEAVVNGPTGRWRVARLPEEHYSAEDRKRLAQLEALSYLQGYKLAPAAVNVTIHDPERAQTGYNLVNSGHAPEATLMDLDGTVRHTWRLEHTRAFPDVDSRLSTSYWRRVRLLPEGDILVIFDDVGIVRLSVGSNIVWKKRVRAHHDLEVTSDGWIYAIRHSEEMIAMAGQVRAALPDNIFILNDAGEIMADYSILECFTNSEYRDMLAGVHGIRRGVRDIFHTNSLRVFDGSLEHISPLFKKGNVVVSLLRLDTIAILDLELKRVVWAVAGGEDGLWYRQHDPTFLRDGQLLLFDNRGHNGRSKVVQLDPFTSVVTWQYADSPEHEFYSETCGAAQRLPNGNTLITESDNGRAFEITEQGEVVWEFWNPFRAGEDGELIATLFEVQRLALDLAPWAAGAEATEPAAAPLTEEVK